MQASMYSDCQNFIILMKAQSHQQVSMNLCGHPVRHVHGAGAKALLSRVDAWVLTLAPHTVDIASKAVDFMNLPQVPPVRLLVPVFPIKNLVTSCQPPADCNRTVSQQKTFVLQGLFQSQR